MKRGLSPPVSFDGGIWYYPAESGAPSFCSHCVSQGLDAGIGFLVCLDGILRGVIGFIAEGFVHGELTCQAEFGVGEGGPRVAFGAGGIGLDIVCEDFLVFKNLPDAFYGEACVGGYF